MLYKCEVEGCEKSFKAKSKLARHVNELHTVGPKSFNCTLCDKSYKRAEHLRRHVKVACILSYLLDPRPGC